MGAEAAVNAVYANKIAAVTDPDERADYVARLRADYERDIDIVHLAAELVVDVMVEPEELRSELIGRIKMAGTKDRGFSRRRHGVTPGMSRKTPPAPPSRTARTASRLFDSGGS